MKMTDESSLHINHTLAGMLWVGLIYFVAWKPGVLDYLWSGSDALVSTVLNVLRGLGGF